MAGQEAFRLNREKYEALIKLRGWKYPITAIAKRTGFTKSYISQVINGGIDVSHDFMLALIKLSGNSTHDPAEWGSLFEVIRIPVQGNSSYQKLNYKKYQGKAAYKEGSLLGKMRQEDKARDLERLDAEEPTPAHEFYNTGAFVPKRAYVSRRYGR